MIRLRVGMAVSCLLLPGCIPLAPAADYVQKRHALLVGIDDYDAVHAPSCPAPKPGEAQCRCEWRDLQGAVNDVHALRDLLVAHYSFRPEDVELLTDRAATREGILAVIRSQLIAPTRPGDEVLFFYAGHGSQVRNSLSDEPDKLDETIVPADARRGVPDIRDKELRRLFNEVLDRGAHLTVIFDSCHSGTAQRGYPPRGRARFLAPDCHDVADASPAGPRPEQRGALILSAAQDDQLAMELQDETTQTHRGAFTWSLLEAMGREGPQASAGEVFLDAKARMEVRGTPQEPVLAGPRQSEPLFGSGAVRSGGGAVVAVTQVDSNGTVYLQGGWASGLGEGSELEGPVNAKGSTRLRLRVTAAKEPARSEARIVSPTRADGALPRTGDLFRLVRWTVASQPSLKAWLPEAGERWEALRNRATALEKAVRAAGQIWVTDPVVETPTHVLSWDQGRWQLSLPGGRTSNLGPSPSPADVVRMLTSEPQSARLFVHLPISPEVIRAIHLGTGTENDAVEITTNPEDAEYYLVGRLNGHTPELAWIRPATDAKSPGRSTLPARTDWLPLISRDVETATALGHTLEDAALRLAKIRAWLTLPSPPGDEFPYHLGLLDSHQRSVGPGSMLPAGLTYGLALEARPQDLASPVSPRYVYIFALNSFGTSTLLFPSLSQGNADNHLPLRTEAGPLATEIRLGQQPSFRIADPLGTDTYFLLTTEQPIPAPSMLGYGGVRSRGPRGTTPLEDLLSQRGSARRGPPSPPLPVTWSIEKVVFESVPARPAP